MVHNHALAIQSARTRAWVHAFVVLARELGGTFGTGYALGPTSRRCAYVGWQTGAHSLAGYLLALAVGTAR